ncbi:MAG: helix-turn-helix transcriptional regulator [Clostridia bacterium]|nr:helix-turn-helix transcriptional regulator [Clostridia bacterium]
MSALTEEIGARIRRYRIMRKLSQEELAEKCGLHPSYIGQVERGEKNATIESINRITEGLSIPLERLFEKMDEATAKDTNYPAEAYRLVQSVPVCDQEKIIVILRSIVAICEG